MNTQGILNYKYQFSIFNGLIIKNVTRPYDGHVGLINQIIIYPRIGIPIVDYCLFFNHLDRFKGKCLPKNYELAYFKYSLISLLEEFKK